MPHFQAILIGTDSRVAGELRAELETRDVPVEAEVAAPADAVARFTRPHDPPRLLVVDVRSAADGTPVRELRAAFPTWPILALADVSGSPAVLLAVNRAGADQVVGVPLNCQDLGAALDLLTLRAKTVERSPVMVAVSGVITGCGCSTIAANLASEIAHGQRLDTILVEAALQMGVQALNLNVRPTITLGDLIGEPETLDADQLGKALVAVAPNLRLVSGPQDLARPGPNATKGVLRALDICKQMATAVVVDVPCQYDDLHFEVLWAADQVVLVADQSLPAVRTARMILDAVSQAKAVKSVRVVLNRYDPGIPAMSAENVSKTLGGVEIVTIPNDYTGVMTAAAEGQVLRSAAPDSPVVPAVRAIAKAVTGSAPAKSTRLITRLVETLKWWGGR